MSIHRNYWLVVGRMCGDDEDTALQFEHCTREDAINAFRDALWEDDTPELSYSNALPGETNEQYRERVEANGEGVFINGVYASDSPIEQP